MAGRRRAIVKWSPHHEDHLVVANKDLRLYQIENQDLFQHEAHHGGGGGGDSAQGNGGLGRHGGHGGHGRAPLLSDGATASALLGDGYGGGGAGGFRGGAQGAHTRWRRSFNILAVTEEGSRLRGLDWCPDPTAPFLVAAGVNTGRVSLVNLEGAEASDDGSDNDPRHFRDFVPKQKRACNAIAWNHLHVQHVVVGYDKLRGDYGTAVWDVHQMGGSSSSGLMGGMGGMGGAGLGGGLGGLGRETITKPVRELGVSEGAVAVSWVPGTPHCVASGMLVKWLRIYDLRTERSTPASVVAHNRGVYGGTYFSSREWQS